MYLIFLKICWTLNQHIRLPMYVSKRIPKISYDLIILIDNGILMAQSPNLPPTQIFPESESKFFGIIPNAQIEFFKNDQGKVTHLVLSQDGESLTGLRT